MVEETSGVRESECESSGDRKPVVFRGWTAGGIRRASNAN